MDVATIETLLAEARNALHRLMTTGQQVEVSYEGRTVRYSSATVGRLETYIRDLETQLARATGAPRRRRALRVTF